MSAGGVSAGVQRRRDMTWLDNSIQRWRIRVAGSSIPANGRVLDIGTSDGALFRTLKRIGDGIGIDPETTPQSFGKIQLVRGFFPQDLPDQRPFDAITLLAVLEHIPPESQRALARNCSLHLRPGGRLITTVPSPSTDHLLTALKRLKLIHGMSLEQHYGYDAKQTPNIFGAAGFQLICYRKFQIGFNNLFVFEKKQAAN